MIEVRRVLAPRPGIPALEPVKQCLYDSEEYPQAGTTQLELYRNPMAGQLWSNMTASAQLPYPQRFDAYGLAIEILPDLPADFLAGIGAVWAADKKRIIDQGWIRFSVGPKDCLIMPLRDIPQGLGPAGLGAGGDAANDLVFTSGVQDMMHYYDLTIRMAGRVRPVHIPPQQTFVLQVNWDNLIAHELGSGIYAKIRAYLYGVLYREVM